MVFCFKNCSELILRKKHCLIDKHLIFGKFQALSLGFANVLTSLEQIICFCFFETKLWWRCSKTLIKFHILYLIQFILPVSKPVTFSSEITLGEFRLCLTGSKVLSQRKISGLYKFRLSSAMRTADNITVFSSRLSNRKTESR